MLGGDARPALAAKPKAKAKVKPKADDPKGGGKGKTDAQKKQTLCAYNSQGYCNKGDKCKYKHKNPEPAAAAAGGRGKGKGKGKGKDKGKGGNPKKEPCKFYFEYGDCKYGAKCHQSHDPKDKPKPAAPAPAAELTKNQKKRLKQKEKKAANTPARCHVPHHLNLSLIHISEPTRPY